MFVCVLSSFSLIPIPCRTHLFHTTVRTTNECKALGDLLLECGISNPARDVTSAGGAQPAVFPHRVLIFAQHRSALDVVEQVLLASHPRLDCLQ